MMATLKIGSRRKLDGERVEVLGYVGLHVVRIRRPDGRLETVPARRVLARYKTPRPPYRPKPRYTAEEVEMARSVGLTPEQVREARKGG